MAASPIEDTWCRHIPLLHRILADESLVDTFPRVSGDLALEEACPVWETLHYLLRHLLGWTDPGTGLAWWYGQGREGSLSPHLALVNRIWNSADKLDYYAAWAWKSHGTKEPYPTDEWWRQFESRSEQKGHNPFHGGTNPLHLGHSDHFGLDRVDPDRSRLHFDPETREAVLVVNRLGSWRRDLQTAGEKLPDLGEHSWHVEIFDRQTGYLGLFRRSRVTGIWFQGKHTIHLRGWTGKMGGAA